jgi:hypothetical protein
VTWLSLSVTDYARTMKSVKDAFGEVGWGCLCVFGELD